MTRLKEVSYTREILHKTKQAEVALITWPRGAVSAPHDHGRSRGRIRVLEGTVYHHVFAKKTKKFLRTETFSVGASFRETPDIIHIMGNRSKTHMAKTIHVYTPALSMKEYGDADFIYFD